MSLPDLLTQYAQIIADEILNECDLDPEVDPAKMRVIRYHAHAIPDDIECSPHGILSVWWENLRPKVAGGPCPIFPVATLNARYVMCWKTPDVKPNSIKVPFVQNDADAARLAQIAECVSRRLFGLVCRQVNAVNEDDEPYDHAFLAMADKPVFLDSTPGGPMGGVAWVNWRIQTGILDIPSGPGPVLLTLSRTADDALAGL